jgi:hypothetical protein
VSGGFLHARAVDAAPHEHLVCGVEDACRGARFGLPGRLNHPVSEGNLSARS